MQIPKVGPIPKELMKEIVAHPPLHADLLNGYRFGEVMGAIALFPLSEMIDDPKLKPLLVRHAYDEGKHTHYFTQKILGLGFESEVPLSVRGLLNMGGTQMAGQMTGNLLREGKIDPQAFLFVMCLLNAVEEQAFEQFEVHRPLIENDRVFAERFDELIKDERFHLDYVRKRVEDEAAKNASVPMIQMMAANIWFGITKEARRKTREKFNELLGAGAWPETVE